jgi:hypothetical protein
VTVLERASFLRHVSGCLETGDLVITDSRAQKMVGGSKNYKASAVALKRQGESVTALSYPVFSPSLL